MIFIIVALVVLIGGMVFAATQVDTRNQSRATRRKTIRIASIVLAIVIATFSAIAIVPSGYTGLRTVFGVVNEDETVRGFSLVVPVVENIVLVDNRQQPVEVKDQIWSESSEQTAVYAAGVVVTYTISPEYSAWIYTHVRNYEHNLISTEMVASAIKVATRSTETKLVTSREVIEPKVLAALQENVNARYGEGAVTINAVVIADMDFEEAYIQAISSRQQAIVQQEQQAIQNQTAIERAEADARVKQTAADADAYAITAQANAEAEANERLSETINANILEYNQIQAWNGQLPMVSGSNSIPIIDFAAGTGTTIGGPNSVG